MAKIVFGNTVGRVDLNVMQLFQGIKLSLEFATYFDQIVLFVNKCAFYTVTWHLIIIIKHVLML